MDQKVRHGNNTLPVIEGNLVTKTTKYSFNRSRANELVNQLISYTNAFDNQPITVPLLHSVALIPSEINGYYHIEFISEYCAGANTCNLSGDDLKLGVKQIIGQIASMPTISGGEDLQIPIDSSAQNFHIQDGQCVLVDVFPPILRLSDGSLPIKNIQFSLPKNRQRTVEFLRGTVRGAIIHTLFTSVVGDNAKTQPFKLTYKTFDWCYDVLPPNINPGTKDAINREIKYHFIPHFRRLFYSELTALTLRTIGQDPYPNTY